MTIFLFFTVKGTATEQNRWLAHSGSKWLKSVKNKFLQSDFTSFSIKVSAYSPNFRFRSLSALHFQNLSNRCRHKYDTSISRDFQSNVWRVFDVKSNCVALHRHWARGSRLAYSPDIVCGALSNIQQALLR